MGPLRGGEGAVGGGAGRAAGKQAAEVLFASTGGKTVRQTALKNVEIYYAIAYRRIYAPDKVTQITYFECER